MQFLELVQTSQQVAGTSRRLAKIGTLADFLRQLSPEEVAIAVHYLTGSTPQGKLGIGYAALQAARVAPASAATLPIETVHLTLSRIAAEKGAGSTQRRAELLRSLFTQATEAEQDFLFRLLIGELRQGALEGIMADAIAKAADLRVAQVQRAAMLAGDLPAVAHAALTEGAPGLARYDLQLFRPVQPMLAQTAEDVETAIADLGEAALEFKMDGARVQVHRSGDEVRVYSRLLNDVTAAVPEVVEVARALPARDLILDGEVLSLLPDGRPQPFQVTMRRFGRRLNVAALRQELPLTPYFFDVLHMDGAGLLDQPQQARFAELARLAPANLIPNLRTHDRDKAEAFLEAALQQGHEGIMAKATEAAYAAGARGQSWLKIKKAHTLDLVVLAAEWGNGRRKGWLSNLHLGARDTANGGWVMLGKTFKGLTDELLTWQTAEFLKRETGRDAYTVYVRPELVVEIAFSDLQVSPRYPGGLALRFARVKRYRADKPASEADTMETVRQIAGL
ncbi:MAG: ATP-dependent DNA ligase [Bryobacterales bacterium]|nr:ATP-dependent DNA ligase [Bryobacterales bacterium]